MAKPKKHHARKRTFPCNLSFNTIMIASTTTFIFALFYSRGKEIHSSLDNILPEPFQQQQVELALEQFWKKSGEIVYPNILETILPEQVLAQIRLMSTDEGNVDFKPGGSVYDEGGRMKHPVVIIPGVAASTLEAWSTTTKRCGQNYFRKKIWGSLSMITAMLLDKECWVKYLMLDHETGLDPKDIKLRATDGIDAVDYAFSGFWLMAKLVSNIAAVGGEPNTMKVASYDWRLDFRALEKRDLYYSRLQTTIENLFRLTKQKVVVVAHSMGNLVFKYFLSWVQANVSPHWPDTYLKAWVDLAGPLLGVTKSLSPMLSGETRDTAQLATVTAELVNRYLNRSERMQLFHSFGSVASMFPKGGSEIWNLDTKSENKVFSVRQPDGTHEHRTMEQMIDLVYETIPDVVGKRWRSIYDTTNGVDYDYLDKPQLWANPLKSPLPLFPSNEFKIYCIYGHGHSTERSYYYSEDPKQPLASRYEIDKSFHLEDGSDLNGVLSEDGDSSVPLLSLGYFGRKGWKSKDLNPSMVPVFTREYKNLKENVTALYRSNDNTDHVDIQGNDMVVTDILNILCGRDEKVDVDVITSTIDEWLNRDGQE